MVAHLPRFLSLPIEVRLQIYQYFLLPPHDTGDARNGWHFLGQGKRPFGNCQLTQAVKSSDMVGNTKLYQQPQCKHPKAHTTLLWICRQVQAEYYPLFASNHVMAFAEPGRFANELLWLMPIQHVSAIRHLRLRFTLAPVWTTTATSVGMYDVMQNTKDLGRMIKAYPELLTNLETFEIESQLHSYVYGGAKMHRKAIFRIIVDILNQATSAPEACSPLQESLSPNPPDRNYFVVTLGYTYQPRVCGRENVDILIERRQRADWERVKDRGNTCRVACVKQAPNSLFKDHIWNAEGFCWGGVSCSHGRVDKRGRETANDLDGRQWKVTFAEGRESFECEWDEVIQDLKKEHERAQMKMEAKVKAQLAREELSDTLSRINAPMRKAKRRRKRRCA